MKLGIQYVVVALVVGVIAGLSISSYVETPLNQAKVVTETTTDTVTVTTKSTVTTTAILNESLNIWPYSLSFNKYGCGPYGWGYLLGIRPNGYTFIYYHGEKGDITANRLLSKPELDNLTSLFVNTNLFALNSSYPARDGYADFCQYSIGLHSSNVSKGVSWSTREAAGWGTPASLQKIEGYFNALADKMVK